MKGKWVIITGTYTIEQGAFENSWPQGLFGKVIEDKRRYCPNTGKKLPNLITVRVYGKGKKWHHKTTMKYIKTIENL